MYNRIHNYVACIAANTQLSRTHVCVVPAFTATKPKTNICFWTAEFCILYWKDGLRYRQSLQPSADTDFLWTANCRNGSLEV